MELNRCIKFLQWPLLPLSLTALIERAQFSLNEIIYHKNALQFNGATGDRSFFEYFLWETEKVHGKQVCILDLNSPPLSYLNLLLVMTRAAKVRRYAR